MLKLIQAGKAVVPDLDNSGTRPSCVNHTIDYSAYPSKRRSVARSTPPRVTGYPSATDQTEPPRYPS